jgi:hypothetical protein
MADTVGAVYVKVIANTAGMKRQIEKAGEEGGKVFGRTWDRAVNKEVRQGQLTDVIEKEMKASAQRTAREWAKATSKGLKNQKVRFEIDQKSMDNIDEAAKRLGASLEEAMSTGVADPKRVAAMIRAAMAEVDRENARSIERRRRQQALYIQWQARTERSLALARQAMEKKEDERRRKQYANYIRWQARTERTLAVAREKAARALVNRTQKIKVDVDASSMVRFMATIKKWDMSLRNFGRRGGIGMSALVTPIRAVTVALANMGSFIKAPLKLLEGLGTMAQSVGKKMVLNLGGGKLSGIFQALGGSLFKAGGGMAKFAQSMAKNPYALAAGAVLALTAGLKVLNVVLGAMVALVNAAAGVLTMLASAAYAAAANIVLLVPMVGALGVGFAGLAVGGMDAFKSVSLLAKAMNETDPKKRAKYMEQYNREIKKLGPNAREAMKVLAGLTKGFTGLKKEAGEALFDGMASSLKAAKPLLDKLTAGLVIAAGAVGDVIDKFLRLGQDTQFVKDLGVMFKGVGVIIRDLGGAMVDVFAGLNSFFAAIQPIVEKFTGAIAKAAEGFREWAQSEKGREKIKAWFEKAYEIGGKVWAIIKEVALAFHDLFTAGMNSETTSGFLDSILGKVEQFREFINAAAEDGRLEEWFRQAKDTAKALWDAIVLVGGALQSLNTEENRKWLISLISGIGSFINFLIDASKIASIAFKPLGIVLGGLFSIIGLGVSTAARLADQFNRLTQSNPFARLADSTKGFRDAIKGAFDWVGRLIGALRRIVWPAVPSTIKNLAGKLFASGGIATTATRAIVGEAGPEAVIPLTRPLSQVDPSVRAMAAMLRGQGGQGTSTSTQGPTKVVNNTIEVYSAASDPEAVAVQIVNRSVAMAG